MRFPTIPPVEKKPVDGRLRNTIYDQQTRSGRSLNAGRLWLYRAAVPIFILLLRFVLGWCRGVRVIGDENVAAALARSPSFIPVYWHQHQLFCLKYLFELDNADFKVGVLVSPSVDGEFGAMLVRRLGGAVIRGSSSHTGARTLRDFYQALVQEGISPVITPDGPRGPAGKFKPGALLLAQLSQRPIVPLAYFASRAWKVSWDRFVIPKIGSRIVIAVGTPIYVAKGLSAESLEALQVEMEQTLVALFECAKGAIP